MIPIALVDDHVVTRRGISTILTIDQTASITMEASNGAELLQKLEQEVLSLKSS